MVGVVLLKLCPVLAYNATSGTTNIPWFLCNALNLVTSANSLLEICSQYKRGGDKILEEHLSEEETVENILASIAASHQAG